MNREHTFSRRQTLYGCTALLGFGLLAAGCDGDNPPAEQPKDPYAEVKMEVSRLIESGMAEGKVPGLSIALVDDQEVVWAQGFGFAEQAARRPATAETLYEIGSISKLFTATAVMQQVERGRVALDRPIQELIPDFTLQSRFPESGPITPRNLLTHHAGIPEQYVGAYTPKVLSLPERMELLRQEHQTAPAEQIWAYSNTGLVVAGRAVEMASGMEFTAAMKQNLLGPLGMSQSSFRVEPHMVPNMSVGHGSLATSHAPPHWLDGEGPAGSMRSSVLDMSRFIKMLLANGKAGETTIVQPETLREMWRQQNVGAPLDLDTRVGITWFLDDLSLANGQSARLVHHGGATLFFRSMLALLPEHKLGVIVLTNTDAAREFSPFIAEEALALALKAKTGLEVVARPREPQVQPVTRPVEELRALEGLYATELGPMKVAVENGDLVANLTALRLVLAPHQQGLFKTELQGTPLWLSFDRIAGHDVVLRQGSEPRLLWSGRQFLGERITPSELTESWKRRLGQYGVPKGGPREFFERARLSQGEGCLLLEIYSAMPGEASTLLLKPEGEERAIVLGLGRGKGEVVRFERQGETQFLYTKGVRLQLESPAESH
ncbi:beta-lactamase [Cystobacter fuscus DSM 2262]|uniref:Beta-lactamase n=1 Tax=Cystobacter fuscus (strain ATCC 25194 / DSM 2262 / NBRC 100088 / M29) TaxID=1242864 RepID=S9PDR3_CYSF2|nr:serine hydrolase domain-containing protein [Cystobacter fuscus]EPX60462.1 beta-lactamase [Cystobacter fuscus DSM 2262]